MHIEAVSSDVTNIHIAGGSDPTWGREMLHFFASELHRAGVRKIQNLTFDENFLLSWRAQAKELNKVNYYYDFTDLAGAETYVPTIADIQMSLSRHLVPRKDEYSITLEKAKSVQVDMVEKLNLSRPKKVAHLPKAQFQAAPHEQVLRLRSLPMFKILKFMNVTSNNYLADVLFSQLGGANAFREFIQSTDLSAHAMALELNNGSGYPLKKGDVKIYNRSSCASIVHALELIDSLVKNSQQGMETVFPVATSDTSTLDKYELPQNVMIAKTGTVTPTIAFAGLIQTKDGPLYFSQLMKTETKEDWPKARMMIKDYLLDLIETKAVPIAYNPGPPLFLGGALSVNNP